MAVPVFEVPDLQSEGHRDLLNVIDKLRDIGVNHYVDLPQIVVCGDQSSGKSSVLEAISGQSFPTETGVCTRFPTELSLRRDDKHKVSVSILPADTRAPDERVKLAKFHETDTSDGSKFDLTKVVQRAMKELGLDESETSPTQKSIVRDVLRIEITGPHLPHLTLVDLPGLFKSSSKTQSDHDKETADEIAKDYTSRDRTVILAVVPAAYDYHVQQGTARAKIADPNKTRTLVLITKPDLVEGGVKGAQKWLNLTTNKDEEYRLGWHVLRNPSFEERDSGQTSRDELEKDFFSHGPWAALDPDRRGAVSLRVRLSEVLKDQIISRLPQVLEDVENEISSARLELSKLGTCRETPEEQRLYLEHIQEGYAPLIREAIAGPYNHPFFASTENGVHPKLYAHVRKLHNDFIDTMNTNGHACEVVDQRPANTSNAPPQISRDDYAAIALGELIKHRGRELPGSYNPATIATLFRKQIKPWGGIIEAHVDSVIEISYSIINFIIAYLTDKTTANAVIRHLNTRKDTLRKDVKEKMRDIEAISCEGHLDPTVPGLGAELAEARRRTDEQILRKALKSLASSDGERIEATVADVLEAVNHVKTTTDMDRYASLQATYVTDAYYKIVKHQTIANISRQVIDSAFLNKLEMLFDRSFVRQLDNEMVKKLAGESQASAEKRKYLIKKIDILETGLSELRLFHQPIQTKLHGSHIESPLHNMTASFSKLGMVDDKAGMANGHSGAKSSHENALNVPEFKATSPFAPSSAVSVDRPPSPVFGSTFTFGTRTRPSLFGGSEVTKNKSSGKAPAGRGGLSTSDTSPSLFGGITPTTNKTSDISGTMFGNGTASGISASPRLFENLWPEKKTISEISGYTFGSLSTKRSGSPVQRN